MTVLVVRHSRTTARRLTPAAWAARGVRSPRWPCAWCRSCLPCNLLRWVPVLILLSSCALSQPTTAGRPSPQPSPAATATYALTGPSPVPTLLDPPPTGCPASPPPPQILTVADAFGITGTGQLVGSSPVWIIGFYDPTSPLHLEVDGYASFPSQKIVWEVGPAYPRAVQVQVRNVWTGALAWWNYITPQWYTQTLLLDPSQPEASVGPNSYHGTRPYQGKTWNEWGSNVLFTQAGCYALDATWAGGHWRVIFAAGR